MPLIQENQWGEIVSPGTLEYSNLTSCMTVTCICSDGTIAGGHAVLIPYAFAYIISQVGELVKGKRVKHICIIGVDTWSNKEELQQIHARMIDYIWQDDSLTPEQEKLYLQYIIDDGMAKAVKAILTASGATNFYTLNIDGKSNKVKFVGNAQDKSVLVKVDKVNKKTLSYGY
ncbi:hypothetical protein [Microcoleus sp. F4-D5]|uniref:hypothetical protein n=1 Tax=Microcoleus sp. F4-D5 TaxID=2818760 RepID=UPI002FD397FA